MTNPLVSIIIVNWNGGEVFKECLRFLKKIEYKNYELIIVDNGSKDGTEKLANVKSKVNLGFAGGNNLGFEKAKGKYVLLLNNDTKVTPDFLSILVQKMEADQTIGVIQPKIKIMDNPELLDAIGSYLTKTGFLEHIGFLEKDSKKYDNERSVFTAKAACVLIRKEIIDAVGLFDERYGSYLEDTDFCWKVWLYGYKVLYYPKTCILHKVGFSSKRQKQTDVNFNSFKNRICTIIKNLEFKNLILIGTLHFLIIIILGIYYLVTLRIKESFIIWKSIWWNVKNLNKTLKKRKTVQAFRRKSDEEIFKYIMKDFDYGKMFRHFLRSEKMFANKHEV